MPATVTSVTASPATFAVDRNSPTMVVTAAEQLLKMTSFALNSGRAAGGQTRADRPLVASGSSPHAVVVSPRRRSCSPSRRWPGGVPHVSRGERSKPGIFLAARRVCRADLMSAGFSTIRKSVQRLQADGC